MPVQIRWNLNVDVGGGPQIGIADITSVDAYDMIEAAIPPSSGSNTTAVEVQPGPADQVRFLMITSNPYGAKLTYTVEGTTHAVALDGPQLFTGSGAIGLLQQPPKKLLFSNKLDGNPTAAVQILVGRMATPPPPESEEEEEEDAGGGEGEGDGGGSDDGGGNDGGGGA